MLHALASPYRERSHFDGQDVLENGTPRPHALQSGWLNRALAHLPGARPREAGVALGQNVPLVMRGPAAVTSWSPSKLAALGRGHPRSASRTCTPATRCSPSAWPTAWRRMPSPPRTAPA